jgi:hypothetical protein
VTYVVEFEAPPQVATAMSQPQLARAAVATQTDSHQITRRATCHRYPSMSKPCAKDGLLVTMTLMWKSASPKPQITMLMFTDPGKDVSVPAAIERLMSGVVVVTD